MKKINMYFLFFDILASANGFNTTVWSFLSENTL